MGQKTIRYDYDLVSNKVKQVWLQEGQSDQFMWRYTYDSDNRILTAESSTEGVIWERDARYEYFLHGPLKRVLIGEDQIQGVDYTYNLQGWLKAVNHPACNPNEPNFFDPGKDGDLATFATQRVAPDAFAMMLHYYHEDGTAHGDFYKSGSPFNADNSNPYQLKDLTNPAPVASGSLYNGNISAWSSRTQAVPQSNQMYEEITGEWYRYDELNRIKRSNFNVWNDATQTYDKYANNNLYATDYRYDGNGNILNLNRKQQNGLSMDELTYHYQAGTNKLTHIDDTGTWGVGSDLIDQNPNNYSYDAIGNLTKDAREGKDYLWTPYGKLRGVRYATGATSAYTGNLDFGYDATGNRVYKVHYADATHRGIPTSETFYVRDAQGNVLSTYERQTPSAVVAGTPLPTPQQHEIHLYGSDRLGLRIREVASTAGGGNNPNGDPNQEPNDPSGSTQRKMVIEEVMYDSRLSNQLGTDEEHLGEYIILRNVWNSAINLGTFSLKNTETGQILALDSVVLDSGGRVIVAFGNGDLAARAQFILANNYPKQNLSEDGLHWQWQTDLILGDDAARLQLFENNLKRDELRYGDDIGKLAENDSSQDSVYVLRRQGYEEGQNTSDYPEYSKKAKEWEDLEEVAIIYGGYVLRTVDLKRYELKDHLGNVSVIVSDVKDATLGTQGGATAFAAIVEHYSHYYPFGMEKPSMVWDKGGYRYGFNGKENDDEIKGVGNSIDFGARIYDSRAARWLSLDPLAAKYPSMSPYNAMGDNPIMFVDIDGGVIKLTGDTASITAFVTRLTSLSPELNFSHDTKTGILTITASPTITAEQQKSIYVKNLITAASPSTYDITLDLAASIPHKFIDSYQDGSVDCGDLAQLPDELFKSNILHIITERNATPNGYDNAKGSAVYEPLHALALDAEAEYMKELFPSIASNIKFNGEYYSNASFKEDPSTPLTPDLAAKIQKNTSNTATNIKVGSQEYIFDFGAVKHVYEMPSSSFEMQDTTDATKRMNMKGPYQEEIRKAEIRK